MKSKTYEIEGVVLNEKTLRVLRSWQNDNSELGDVLLNAVCWISTAAACGEQGCSDDKDDVLRLIGDLCIIKKGIDSLTKK